jgi:hypothetical protein
MKNLEELTLLADLALLTLQMNKDSAAKSGFMTEDALKETGSP